MASNSAIYFWKPHEQPYGFLSQWYDCAFEVNGVRYAHTEMWMMIQKAKLFGDEQTAKEMMQTNVPSEHQRLGRLVQGFDRALWMQHKSQIVEEGNFYKFSSHEDLAEQLLATGDRELVEASPEDRIWGVGFDAANAESHRNEWGENRLGKAIMAARRRLKTAPSQAVAS